MLKFFDITIITFRHHQHSSLGYYSYLPRLLLLTHLSSVIGDCLVKVSSFSALANPKPPIFLFILEYDQMNVILIPHRLNY